jgi:hypothetical protein
MLARPPDKKWDVRSMSAAPPSAAELDRVLITAGGAGRRAHHLGLQYRRRGARVVLGGDGERLPSSLDLEPLVAGSWGRVATHDRLEGFGVGGAADDDEAGQL